MPKVKDVLNLLSETLTSNELSAAIGSSDGLNTELTEDGYTDIQSKLGSMITQEAALNDPEFLDKAMDNLPTSLHNKQRAKYLHKVESELTALGDAIGIPLKGEFFNKQVETLRNEIPKLKQESNGNANETIETLRKENQELNESLSKVNEDWEGKFNQVQSRAESEIKQFKIDSKLWDKFNDVKLSKNLEDPRIKKGLFNTLKSEILNEAHLDLSENEDIIVRRKDNPEMDLYDKKNNKLMGLDDLFIPKVQPYIAKVEKRQDTIVTTESKIGDDAKINPNSTMGAMMNARKGR